MKDNAENREHRLVQEHVTMETAPMQQCSRWKLRQGVLLHQHVQVGIKCLLRLIGLNLTIKEVFYTTIFVTISDTTKDGVPCSIPFHGKKNDMTSPKFYRCTDYDTSKLWCATTTKGDNTWSGSDWDWC